MSQLARPAAARADVARLAARLEELLARPAVHRPLVLVAVLVLAWRWGSHPSARTAALLFAPLPLAMLLRAPTLLLPALVLATALVRFAIGTGTNSSINVTLLLVAALFAADVARQLGGRRVRLPRSESNRAWLALCLVAALSILAGGASWDPRVVVAGNFLEVQLGQLAVFALSAAAFWLPGMYMKRRVELERLVVLLLLLGLYQLVASRYPALAVVEMPNGWSNPVVRIWMVAFSVAWALFDDHARPLARVALLAYGIAHVGVAALTAESWASGWLPSVVVISTLLALRLGRISVAIGTVTAVPAAAAFFAMLLPYVADSDRWSLNTRVIAWRGLLDLLDGRWLLGLGLASYWHYWRGVIGMFAYYDPATGYSHFTTDPHVNMHNNFMDVLGQMGVVGVLVLVWLFAGLTRHAWRVYRVERAGFGHAYGAACLAGIAGMLAAGMLGDWFFPFVYNIGLEGFRGAAMGWLFLGGLCVVDAARAAPARPPE